MQKAGQKTLNQRNMNEIDGEVFSVPKRAFEVGAAVEGVPPTICKMNQSYTVGLSLGLFSS